MDQSNQSMKCGLKDRVGLALILLAGMAARLAFYNSIDGAISTSDSPTYVDGAFGLFYHFWLNEYRPPVYPLGIGLMGSMFLWKNLNTSLVLLQVLLSLINVAVVFKLTLEAFGKRVPAYMAALATAVSFRIFSWDFVILSENFAILFATVIAYYMVLYLKYKNVKHLKRLLIFVLLAIFTKPFFLLLPLALLVILFIRQLTAGDLSLRSMVRPLSAGIAAVYLTVFSYCLVNYAQNVYFGITSVGNVNYFGKILQYKMEGLGKNRELIGDIEYAFKVEKPEFKVKGEYLEPWHFVGTYGWTENHYREVGKFAREIILSNPVRYFTESTRLTYQLFVLNSPFKDFIAEYVVERASHPDRFFMGLKKVTGVLDGLYLLLVLGVIELLSLIVLGIKQKKISANFHIITLMLLILYHYFISSFLSYGDYCRLLAPCYPLIYIILCIYLYRPINWTVQTVRGRIRARL